MKSLNLDTPEKKAANNTVLEKQFPGKPLNATVFSTKFKAANEVGHTIKGFKERKK